MSETRKAIRELMAQNRDVITRDLHAMLHRNAEDMIAAGIDRAQVSDAAFNVGVTHQVAVLGLVRTSELLRAMADLFEQWGG